jgi:hypothetical protein
MITILSMAFEPALFPNANMERHGNAATARIERGPHVLPFLSAHGYPSNRLANVG